MSNIDSPAFNDNRNYNYSGFEDSQRNDYKYIADLIEDNSRIVDLGCGNGTLMQILKDTKNCFVKGVEISPSGVEICRKKGLDVVQGRIDEALPFEENEFDYSICHITIQMVMYPEILLKEMKRISKYQIVSFPNFAFYKNRLELLIKGKMPKKMLFGYSWYNTGHIHQLSIRDFEELIGNVGGLKVIQRSFVKTDSQMKNFFMKLFPNMFQLVAVIKLTKL